MRPIADSSVFPSRVNARAAAARIPCVAVVIAQQVGCAGSVQHPHGPWFGRISRICCMSQIGFWPSRPAVRPCFFSKLALLESDFLQNPGLSRELQRVLSRVHKTF
jgi:hypothetical protein